MTNEVLLDENGQTEDDRALTSYVVSRSSPKDDKARLAQVVAEIGGDENIPDRQEAIQDALSSSPRKNRLRKAVDGETSNSEAVQLKKQQALANKAEKLQVPTARAQARIVAEEAKQNKALRDEQLSASAKQLQTLDEKVATPLINKGRGIISKVASLPTVGSVGLLLTFLILLLFVVVDVDGKGTTRIKQLWYMLNGRASLTTRISPVDGSQVAGSASTSGNTSPPNNGVLPTQGTLPGATSAKINYGANITGDTNQFNRDLLLGNFTGGPTSGDIVNTALALKDIAALNKDFSQKNDKNVRADVTNLQIDVNKLNQTQYNADYHTLYTDLGF